MRYRTAASSPSTRSTKIQRGRSSTASCSWTCSASPSPCASRVGRWTCYAAKLAAEPQIHGGKRTRVVFHEEMIDGRLTFLERSEKRSDR